MNGQLAWTQAHRHADAPGDERDDDRRRARRPTPPTPGSTSASTCPPTSARASRPGWSPPSSTPRTGEPGRGPHPQPRGLDAPHRHPRRPRHLRPRPPASPPADPGELAVDITFPTAGPLHRQHRVPPAGRDGRRARPAGHHRRRPRTGAGTGSPRARGAWSSTASGSQLDGDAEAGRRSDLHFTLTDAATGRPVDDLQPYLAAAGHIVDHARRRADLRPRARRGHRRRRPPGVRPARHHVRPRARRARRLPHRRDLPAVGASSASPTATSSPSRSPSRPADQEDAVTVPDDRHMPPASPGSA